jgi:hypothetical protein
MSEGETPRIDFVDQVEEVVLRTVESREKMAFEGKLSGIESDINVVVSQETNFGIIFEALGIGVFEGLPGQTRIEGANGWSTFWIPFAMPSWFG